MVWVLFISFHDGAFGKYFPEAKRKYPDSGSKENLGNEIFSGYAAISTDPVPPAVDIEIPVDGLMSTPKSHS